MAIIKSTDKRFYGRKYGIAKFEPFAAVYETGGRKVLRFSAGVSYGTTLPTKCLLSYDTENRELLVEKDSEGNVKITNDGTSVKQRLNIITSFYYWDEAFGINADNGRYEAVVQPDGNVRVLFNRKVK